MKTLTLPIGAGSEPDCIEIDDAKEVIGETETFPDVVELCWRSPSGHHAFNMQDGFERCIYCGREVES